MTAEEGTACDLGQSSGVMPHVTPLAGHSTRHPWPKPAALPEKTRLFLVGELRVPQEHF